MVRPAVELAGEVTADRGIPLGGARISVAPSWTLDRSLWPDDRELPVEALGRQWSMSTTSDEKGGFRLDGIAAGEWTLLAEADGYQPARESVLVDPTTAPPAAVLRLSKNVCWKVTVVDGHARPVPEARVAAMTSGQLRTAAGFAESRVTDEDGTAWLCETPAPGASVRVTADDHAMALARNREGAEEMSITLSPGGTLTGRWVGPTGPNAARVTLRIQPEGEAMLLHHAEPDEMGTFELASVRTGHLLVWMEDGGTVVWRTEVDLEAGGRVDLGRIDPGASGH